MYGKYGTPRAPNNFYNNYSHSHRKEECVGYVVVKGYPLGTIENMLLSRDIVATMGGGGGA